MRTEGAAGAGDALAPRFALPIICIAALAALLPELATGLSLSDSFRYNIVWTEQFRDLARTGILYPRWLPGSWGGLGSPTFYFYPPLYFWLAAFVDAVTLHLLPIDALVSATSALVLALSGVTMRIWLRIFVPPRAALLGALAYMVAPYHIYDIYARGALAESCAYALLPLIALAIRRLAEGRKRYFFLFAASYAGLALSHLPSALLASLFLIPAYAIFCGLRYAASLPRFLAAIAAGAIAGIGISACYLLPALTLLPFISANALAGPHFQPETWFFWRPAAWPQPEAMGLIVPLAAAALLLVAGAARARRRAERNLESRLWAGVAIAGILMLSGAIPFLWKLPFLAQVQFPWRLYVIVEFAVITCLAASMPLRWNFALAAATIILYGCLIFTGILVSVRAHAFSAGRAANAAAARRDYREAPEYLPRGRVVPPGTTGAPDPARMKFPRGPEASAAAPGARTYSVRRKDGGLEIVVDSAVPTLIVARRFYFPHWQVVDGAGRRVAAAPSPGSRRLSWRAPAGRTRFIVRSGAAPLQQLGFAISLAAILALLALAAWLFRHGGKPARDILEIRR